LLPNPKLSSFLVQDQASHGIVTASINFKNETDKLSLKELVSNNVRELLEYFNKKAYDISHVAILGNNINSQLPD